MAESAKHEMPFESEDYKGCIRTREGRTVQRVVAIDPGETCGFVVADIDTEGELYILSKGECRWDRWKDWWMLVGGVEHVICENFRLFQAKARHLTGSELHTVRVIGALQSLAWMLGASFVLQEPSILSAYSNTHLKTLEAEEGMSYWSPSPHIRSAIKHLLWFAKRYTPPERKGGQE